MTTVSVVVISETRPGRTLFHFMLFFRDFPSLYALVVMPAGVSTP